MFLFADGHMHHDPSTEWKTENHMNGGPEFHLLPADLGSGWRGSWPLLDLNPGLRVQVGKAGRQALGHRLEVGNV